VEPSGPALAQARPAARERILETPFRAGLFPRESFSLVCGFQVLDHLLRPNEVLQACRELLAPGGLMLWICHDERALPARLLGRLSPIVDIQHVVLYNRRTVARLFERNAFTVLRVFGVRNRYPLGYWARLVPLPGPLRRFAQRALAGLHLADLPVTLNPGNLGILAAKGAPGERRP
jgi:SAM-dependent methyltransferase